MSRCCAGANGQQARVSVGAAVDGDMEQARQRDVGHVAAMSRDEPPVLPPAYARPEQPLGHQPLPSPPGSGGAPNDRLPPTPRLLQENP
jgi:hypothetical protein